MNGKNASSLTRLAARRLQRIAEGDISPEVRSQASLCILDGLGAMQCGLAGELADSLRTYALQNDGFPESYSFAAAKSVSAETAAFTNGVLAHSAIRDDMHLPSVAHIGTMVFPAAFAIAQRSDWSGEQLVRAVIGGYEMGALLGTALRRGGTVNPNFRASGLIGAFAAAGAAASGQWTNEDSAVSALGLAVNSICGINAWAWSAGSEIWIQNGMASRAGISAHSLAVAGICASEAVLEGKNGFFEALGAGPKAAIDFEQWLQVSPIGQGIMDVKFKPMGCCNYTQTSTAIALRIAKGGNLVTDDIDRIVITTTEAAICYPGCDNDGPVKNVLQGKSSIQYGVCAALVLTTLDEQAWNPKSNSGVTSLMHKCTLLQSEGFNESYREGRQPARVEVFLKTGQVLKEEAEDVPWLSGSEVIARFLREMGAFGDEIKVKKLLHRLQHLEEVQQCRDLLQS